MGTQQILLIVLSVVVVGIAVAVGITMFQNQAVNSARQSIMSDLNNFAAQAMAWYKMPESMGGGGQVASITETELPSLRDYLGFDGTGDNAGTDEFENDNAVYSLAAGDANSTTVRFTSIPKETALTDNAPALDVDLIDGTITPYPTGTGNTGT
jgi:hypothetical protein